MININFNQIKAMIRTGYKKKTLGFISKILFSKPIFFPRLLAPLSHPRSLSYYVCLNLSFLVSQSKAPVV